MKEGKLDWKVLKQLIAHKGYENEGIIMGARPGCDTAVIDTKEAARRAQEYYQSKEEPYLVFKTDPITFPTTSPGKYAVIVNANDVVTAGALPFGFNATIIVPPDSAPIDVIKIQEGIHNECLKNKITVLGGHTEVSSSVASPIVSGAMFGYVPRDYYVSREIEEGDIMLCVGWCAKEGVGIIASEGYEELVEVMETETLNKLMELGNEISVVETALELNKKYQPSLLHDATEGGVMAAAYEAIAVENYGLTLSSKEFPITKETNELCKMLGISPLKLISSGTLLVVAPEEKASEIMKEGTKERPIRKVGIITEEEKGLKIDGEEVPPPQPDALIQALRRVEKKEFE